MLQQLAQWGAPPDVLQATEQRLQAEAAQATVPVWPEHWHALQLLLAMATQWRWLMGHKAVRQGLRYEAVTPLLLRAVARQVPRRLRRAQPVLMQQLQAMERAVLEHQRAKL